MRKLILALIAALGLLHSPSAHASLDWERDLPTEFKRRIINADFPLVFLPVDVESEAPKKKTPIKSDADYNRVMGLVVAIAQGSAVDKDELAWGKAYVAQELTAEGLEKSRQEFIRRFTTFGFSQKEAETLTLEKMVELQTNLAQIQKALNLAVVKN